MERPKGQRQVSEVRGVLGGQVQGCLGEAGAEEVPKSSPDAGPLGEVHTSFLQVRGWEPQPPIARLEAGPRPRKPSLHLGGPPGASTHTQRVPSWEAAGVAAARWCSEISLLT